MSPGYPAVRSERVRWSDEPLGVCTFSVASHTCVFLLHLFVFTGPLTSSITVSIVFSIWTSFVEVCWPLSLRCSQLCCRFLSPCKTVGLTAALPYVSCVGFLPAATRGWGSVQVLVTHYFRLKIGLKDPNTPINQMVHHF